jgi:NADPH:quinone reductase-like Zn-dependent oxidoreductase
MAPTTAPPAPPPRSGWSLATWAFLVALVAMAAAAMYSSRATQYSATETMRAVVHNASSPIGQRTFRTDQPRPIPGAGQMLVRVHAAAINPVDFKIPALLRFGSVVGLDFAGVVVATNASGWAVGDHVFGMTTHGTLADYTLVAGDEVARKPAALSWTQAASLGVAYLTAYQSLRACSIQAGESILIVGASGGCGAAGVQLANAMGLSHIAGVASAANAKLVESLGATQFVDYGAHPDLTDVFPPASFDCVYDAASFSGGGEDYTAQALALVKPGRKLAAINAGPLKWLSLFTGVQRLTNPQHLLLVTQRRRSDLEEIVALMGAVGRRDTQAATPTLNFEPLIEQVYEFTADGVERAFEHLKSRRARGKLVFQIAPASA